MTIAEGVLLRPVMVKVDMKLKKSVVGTFTFEVTFPSENGSRKFTGKMTKTGITLTETGTSMVLKTKCYQ